jgi:quercetin dioxygenase-like cupin family protein
MPSSEARHAAAIHLSMGCSGVFRYKLDDLHHFVFSMLGIDREKGLVDFIIKFEANQQIVLHRHLALTNTLVVQGEHRLYEPNGALKEIRPVGSYTSSPPGEPHGEGGEMKAASSSIVFAGTVTSCSNA